MPCPAGFIGTSEGKASCEKCPAGSYSSSTTNCSVCPLGTSSDNGIECKKCPPGTGGVKGETGLLECRKCKAGYYAVNGVCEECPTGSIGTSEGKDSCEKCPLGTYSSSTTTCTTCPIGTFSDNGKECKACPPGTIGVKWKSGLIECRECPAGYYAIDGVCEECTQGFFSRENSTQCEPCAPGTIAPGKVSDRCVECLAGSYEFQRVKCIECPKGTFSPYGARSSGECQRCPEGSISPNTRSYKCDICDAGRYEADRKECLDCPPNLSSPKGSSSFNDCKPCPPGTMLGISPTPRECTKCPAGTFSKGANDHCSECPQGTFSAIGASECTPCPAGFITKGPKSAECMKCDPGYYEEDRKNCVGCPRGTYAPQGGASIADCLQCPPTTITKGIGNAKCEQCNPGTYEVNRKVCENCPYGTFSPVAVANISECQQCSEGWVCQRPPCYSCEQCGLGRYENHRSGCAPCPKGTYSDVIGISSPNDCKKCGPGLVPNSSQTGCKECSLGSYAFNSTSCYGCPPGTYSQTSGLATAEECTPCPPGTTSEYGYGRNCFSCNAGQYELDRKKCMDCPAGTFAPQGESGIAECEACPPGTTSPPASRNENDCLPK